MQGPALARAAAFALLLISVWAAAWAGACSPPAAAPAESAPGAQAARGAAGPAIDLDRYRLVDLTYPFGAETIYWPTATSGFELTEVHHGPTEGGYFYAANSFCAPEHGGTHLDAPIHFSAEGETADRVPLDRLVAPAVVIDVSDRAAADPDYRLTTDDVAAFESAHGAVPTGSIVLLRTGWGERWPDRRRYLGDDTPGDASNLHFPSYGREAAALLVEERKVAALGVDTASIDHGPSTDFVVHRVAAAANVPGLENVAHLEELPATGAWVLALPVKVEGGSGGPARIVALVPRGDA
jgi:kynurenine formamidase